MRALRVLFQTVVVFLIAGCIIGTIALCVLLGLRYLGQWGPFYLSVPLMFVGFFLLMLSDGTIK